METESPEEPGVRGAVPLLGEPGKIGTFHRFAGSAALDRGGVGDPHIVSPQAGIGGEVCDHRLYGAGEFA